MSRRVSRIQRQIATTAITTPMPEMTQEMHDAGDGERQAEGGDHRQVGRAGQVDGLARRRASSPCGVDVLVRHQ